jgi:hypothetical protein
VLAASDDIISNYYRALLSWGLGAHQPASIWSPGDWYARTLGNIDFPPLFVLFFLTLEELASETGRLGRFYPAKDPQNLVGTELSMDAA